MGSIACVTTFSEEGRRVYGERMIETYRKFWPSDIKLHIYDDKRLAEDNRHGEFVRRHNDHPTDYRKQPVKFCHKVFAVTSAPRDTDWLIWLDGDVETTAPVTHELLDGLLPDDCVASYMGRKWWKHTEAGFLAYHCGKEPGSQFLNDMRSYYTTDKVLELRQQHDCMVFDTLRMMYEAQGYKFNDLGKDYRGPGLDVMPHTPLGAVMQHHKGNHGKLKAYGAVA